MCVVRFEGESVNIDRLKVTVPSDIPLFLTQRSHSQFIECSHSRAAAFHQQQGIDEGRDAVMFRHKAWKLLAKAKKLLDELQIPFWLSSGTCLGMQNQHSNLNFLI